MYLNKTILVGNLTRDIELKALPSGIKVANFSMATNRTWKDKEGVKHEDVEFHNVVSFGKQAEVLAQYVFKGHQLLVEGRLQTRSWEDKTSGEKKYRTEIMLENFQFGNNPKKEGATAEPKKQENLDKIDGPDQKEPETMSSSDIDYPEEAIDPQDIPF